MAIERGETTNAGTNCPGAVNKAIYTNTFHWTVFWIDSVQGRNVNLSANGQCIATGQGLRYCVPDFYTPYWATNSARVDFWNQQTLNYVIENGSTTQCTPSGPIADHFNRHVCSTVAELPQNECTDSGYSWNYTTGTCQDPEGTIGDPNSCIYGQIFNYEAGMCCPDPPTMYPCDSFLPDTACPYSVDASPCWPSPILIDIAGDGFDLTDAAGGVDFDIEGNSDRVKEHLAWTRAGSDDAWLALDRNGNGSIDSGRELFGNYAPHRDQLPGANATALLLWPIMTRRRRAAMEIGQLTRRMQSSLVCAYGRTKTITDTRSYGNCIRCQSWA